MRSFKQVTDTNPSEFITLQSSQGDKQCVFQRTTQNSSSFCKAKTSPVSLKLFQLDDMQINFYPERYPNILCESSIQKTTQLDQIKREDNNHQSNQLQTNVLEMQESQNIATNIDSAQMEDKNRTKKTKNLNQQDDIIYEDEDSNLSVNKEKDPKFTNSKGSLILCTRIIKHKPIKKPKKLINQQKRNKLKNINSGKLIHNLTRLDLLRYIVTIKQLEPILQQNFEIPLRYAYLIMKRIFTQGNNNMNLTNSDCSDIHYKYKKKWKTVHAITKFIIQEQDFKNEEIQQEQKNFNSIFPNFKHSRDHYSRDKSPDYIEEIADKFFMGLQKEYNGQMQFRQEMYWKKKDYLKYVAFLDLYQQIPSRYHRDLRKHCVRKVFLNKQKFELKTDKIIDNASKPIQAMRQHLVNQFKFSEDEVEKEIQMMKLKVQEGRNQEEDLLLQPSLFEKLFKSIPLYEASGEILIQVDQLNLTPKYHGFKLLQTDYQLSISTASKKRRKRKITYFSYLCRAVFIVNKSHQKYQSRRQKSLHSIQYNLYQNLFKQAKIDQLYKDQGIKFKKQQIFCEPMNLEQNQNKQKENEQSNKKQTPESTKNQETKAQIEKRFSNLRLQNTKRQKISTKQTYDPIELQNRTMVKNKEFLLLEHKQFNLSQDLLNHLHLLLSCKLQEFLSLKELTTRNERQKEKNFEQDQWVYSQILRFVASLIINYKSFLQINSALANVMQIVSEFVKTRSGIQCYNKYKSYHQKYSSFQEVLSSLRIKYAVEPQELALQIQRQIQRYLSESSKWHFIINMNQDIQQEIRIQELSQNALKKQLLSNPFRIDLSSKLNRFNEKQASLGQNQRIKCYEFLLSFLQSDKDYIKCFPQSLNQEKTAQYVFEIATPSEEQIQAIKVFYETLPQEIDSNYIKTKMSEDKDIYKVSQKKQAQLLRNLLLNNGSNEQEVEILYIKRFSLLKKD